MNFKLLSVAAATALCFSLSANAAGTSTADFQVKITITESCDMKTVAPTDVDFGSVVRGVAAADVQGKLVVNCSQGTSYQVALSDGANASGPGARRMAQGTNFVAYNLFKDATYSTPWTASDTGLQTGVGTGANVDVPVYARVPAGATNVPAGDYLDTVRATLTY